MSRRLQKPLTACAMHNRAWRVHDAIRAVDETMAHLATPWLLGNRIMWIDANRRMEESYSHILTAPAFALCAPLLVRRTLTPYSSSCPRVAEARACCSSCHVSSICWMRAGTSNGGSSSSKSIRASISTSALKHDSRMVRMKVAISPCHAYGGMQRQACRGRHAHVHNARRGRAYENLGKGHTCCAVLSCASLHCAVLCCAVLCCAVLCCAVLCCPVLCCAVLP